MLPTREIYWQIHYHWLMYVFMVLALAIFAYGVHQRYKLWITIGKPTNRFDQHGKRMGRTLKYILAHTRLMRDCVAGWMHGLMFWSMFVLLIGTAVIVVEADLSIPIMNGKLYLVFQSLFLDIFGLLGLVGLFIAIFRRYISRVPRLQHNREGVLPDNSNAISLLAFFIIFAQGFALEAIRIAAVPQIWDVWSPVGYALAMPLAVAKLGTLITAYQVTWWFHMFTVFAWIAYIPYSKMFHLITSTANVYLSTLEPPGVTLKPIDFENIERFGASALFDFTWKDLLDLDACTSCGRCQAVCPAYASGQPLSPKNLILDLRDYMSSNGSTIIAAKEPIISNAAGTSTDVAAASETEWFQNLELPVLVDGAIKTETLWSCTTCRACMEECPAFIEHVPKIIDMRRHLAMEQAEAPDTLQDALKSLEDRTHPYKGNNASRTDWCDEMDIQIASEKAEGVIDVLFWVGCNGAFDNRNQKIVRAFAELMQIAKVNFVILGPDEICCGDPARRIGNEFMYDMIVRQNIEVLTSYKPKRIVTTCPHCFNAIGNEYRQFGGEFEVLHHTQFLKELVDAGQLKVNKSGELVTYHDPCYLGRYNSEYAVPRDLIRMAGTLIEMERNSSKSFCCGAGGGHAWMEEHGNGPRVNQIRAQEAIDTGVGLVAVSCPFCMQMLEDGLKTVAGAASPKVKDIAELLLEGYHSSAG